MFLRRLQKHVFTAGVALAVSLSRDEHCEQHIARPTGSADRDLAASFMSLPRFSLSAVSKFNVVPALLRLAMFLSVPSVVRTVLPPSLLFHLAIARRQSKMAGLC
jgi:hypothetical protein